MLRHALLHLLHLKVPSNLRSLHALRGESVTPLHAMKGKPSRCLSN